MAEPTYEQLREENQRLKRRVAELERTVREQARQIAALKSLVERLQQELEKSQREAKRQAAPFSKGPPQAKARRPGRKAGPDYGRQNFRRPPDPAEIDETYEARLPECCPGCGGQMAETGVRQQYQVELPQKPIQRQFHVHLGRCTCCGLAVQGRHELMTSDALGAAGSQLGARVQALMVFLNKRLGLSQGKIAELFTRALGIPATRGGVMHVVLRSGRRLEPAYGKIRQRVRGSPFVVPDETGWRLGGRSAWLHACVGRDATCYEIAESRGAEVMAGLLGWDYRGTMIHDGWAPYDGFLEARHQQCLAHIFRRCRRLLDTARGGAVRLPRAVLDVFGQAIAVRDRFDAGEVCGHGRRVLAGRLRERLRRLVALVKSHAANERLAAHLESHLDDWFTFLRVDGVDATNWRAEQAIRPAVVNRKVWGGNRTGCGARAQSVLMSVLATCYQQGCDPLRLLTDTLRSRSPRISFAVER
ncbi:MAG TPA: IS66 family transposase [Woeseiaceae bacterium]|nr:IS66 family transposase [Woeseiaceae bacterium]